MWIEATIMQNLQDGAFVVTVKVLMSLNLILMMPITMLPAYRALESRLAEDTSMLVYAILRLSIIATLALAAALFPGFESIMGFTGALGCLTGFTLPALCYAHFCARRLSTIQKGVAYFVAGFGLFATAFSFAQQVNQLMLA